MEPDDEAKEWVSGVFDRAASTYDEVAGSYHDHFGARLVDLVGVGPSDVVLDVACGRLRDLMPAAVRVGAGGSVVGVDLSPEIEHRAVRRPFDQASDLEALLRAGGLDLRLEALFALGHAR